jgi:hypothetical protein
MTPEELASKIQSKIAPILASVNYPSEDAAALVIKHTIIAEMVLLKATGVIRFFTEILDPVKHIAVYRGLEDPTLLVVQYAYYFKHGPARNGQYVARILKSENGTYRIKTGVWEEGELPFIDPAKRFSSVVAASVVEEEVVVIEPVVEVEPVVVEPVVPVVVVDPTPAVEEDVKDLTELVAQAVADPEGSVVVNYSTPAMEEVVEEAVAVEPDVTAALSEKTYDVEGLTELVAQAVADPEGSVVVNYLTPAMEEVVGEPVAVMAEPVSTENTDFMTKSVIAKRGYNRKAKKASKEPLVGEEAEVASNLPTAPVEPEEPKE